MDNQTAHGQHIMKNIRGGYTKWAAPRGLSLLILAAMQKELKIACLNVRGLRNEKCPPGTYGDNASNVYWGMIHFFKFCFMLRLDLLFHITPPLPNRAPPPNSCFPLYTAAPKIHYYFTNDVNAPPPQMRWHRSSRRPDSSAAGKNWINSPKQCS